MNNGRSSLSASAVDRPGGGARLREFFWGHPEWWCVAGVCLAWAVVLQHARALPGVAPCNCGSAVEDGVRWMFMVAAMMVPLHLDALRQVAFRSLRRRRHRAVAAFLLGYAAPWAALGLGVAATHGVRWLHGSAPAACAFGVAAAWAMTPARRRAVIACHRAVPLAPVGVRADADCARFGASVGAACVATCAATMVACALSGHSLVAMLGGAAIAIVERLSFRQRPGVIAASTLGLAALFGFTSLLSIA